MQCALREGRGRVIVEAGWVECNGGVGLAPGEVDVAGQNGQLATSEVGSDVIGEK